MSVKSVVKQNFTEIINFKLHTPDFNNLNPLHGGTSYCFQKQVACPTKCVYSNLSLQQSR